MIEFVQVGSDDFAGSGDDDPCSPGLDSLDDLARYLAPMAVRWYSPPEAAQVLFRLWS